MAKGASQDERSYMSSLNLEDDDDEATAQPRRFLRLPSGHVLAYGGDNGNVSCLLPEVFTKSDGKRQGHKFVIVQRYNDEVRSIAVSQDGKRLAIGFDTGSTQICCFDDQNSTLSVHPYVQALEKNKTTEEKFDDDLMLSQDCSIDDKSTYFAGPDLGAPIRDMLFLPSSSRNDSVCNDTSSTTSPYLLAIASEAGMCVIDVTSKDIMTGSEHLLEQEAKEFHDQCGIRGLAASVVESHDRSNDNSHSKNSRKGNKMIVLASLAMDGRLCLWDVTNMRLLKREEQRSVPKKDLGEIHDADAYDRSCRPVIFHPDCAPKNTIIISTPGKLTPCLRVLQLNGGDGKTSPDLNLQLIDESSFELIPENETGHIQSIVSIFFCSDRLLVTSGRDSRVQVWEGQNSNDIEFLTKQWKVVETYQVESPVTDFCMQYYQKKEKILLFSACANGSLQVFDISKHHRLLGNVSTKNSTDKNISIVATSDVLDDKEDCEERTYDTTSNKTEGKDRSQDSSTLSKRVLKKSHLSDDKDDDDSVDFSSHEESSRTPKKNVHFLDEADEDDDHNDELDKINRHSNSAAVSDGVTDFENDSVASEHSLMEDDLTRHKFIQHPIRMMDVVKPQPAFSPSSTPLDLTRRFLCWNHIGSVSILQGDDQRNTIDINFTESAVRRPITFTDNINFIIGSVGESGGIFASDIQDHDDDILDGEDIDELDELNMSERTKQAVRRDQRNRDKGSDNSRPTGSSIFFYRFDSIGNQRNKDWHLILPDGERVLGAACGEGWSAVMTSRRFLRLFSSGGNQNQLIWLKGEPVTMVGRGRLLAVFYHESSPLPNKTQQVGYTLFDAKGFRVLSRGSVSCVSKGSSISWVGFNNDFSLTVMDSDGMLSILVGTGQRDNVGTMLWEWVPVLDTIGLRKSTDDIHWPITVYNGKLICIPLKGGNTYPDATRRPVTTTLGLRMPLARSVLSKNSALEELSVRSNIALAQKKFINDNELDYDVDYNGDELEKEYTTLCKQVDKVTIKLFAAMVDAGKFDSALELVSRLHSEKSYDIAIRYADRHNSKLATGVEREMELKFGSEESDDYDVEQQDYNQDDEGFSNTFVKRSEDINSKQISPDSGRTQKRSMKLQQTADIENKRHRVD